MELVQQAQSGDGERLNRLTGAVRERLYAYVYRYTLDEDLTHDIVQGSILKMLEALGQLREVEQFWPWLYKIAINQVRLHHRNEKNHKTVSDPDMDSHPNQNDSQEVIAGMVYEEFREAVFAAMGELKPEHRSVINMRCYDQMKYAEIAKVIGRSEFAAQKLFFRAKKTLKQKLARRGLGRGSVLMALVLFGKLTASSKAAAAGVSVTSAAIKVGTLATLAEMAVSNTAILSLTTAGVLTVGAVVATSLPESDAISPTEQTTNNSYTYVMPQKVDAVKDTQEYWYYYPSKAPNTVMMRVKAADGEGPNPYCHYLQNDEGNYHFDSHTNTVYIENYRQWQKDFSVWRLPTDSLALTDFLAQIDGGKRCAEDVQQTQSGLLLVIKQPGQENSDRLVVTRHTNVLGEDYFKNDWPANVKVVDNRDAMHKRGWTYFTVSGQIDGNEVEGSGRIPFVYVAGKSHWPWMKLRVGDRVYIDKGFEGFARPWAGLHTIDTVRRDAAQKLIPFETKLRNDGHKAQVTLTAEFGCVIYTIDMEHDIVEKIVFTGGRKGELEFEYQQEIDDSDSRFVSPRNRYGQNEGFGVLEIN